jgi:hypothetical protein
VSPEKSRGEIERILVRYGADQFVYAYDQERAVIAFRANGRQVRFNLSIPKIDDFAEGPGWRSRTELQQKNAWEQVKRQRWRALALTIKAKLEAVEVGITTFEEEFLAHIMLPGGVTVGAWLGPQIERAYTDGEMPSLLPQLGAG